MAFSIPTYLKFKPPNVLDPRPSDQHHCRPLGVWNPMVFRRKLSVLARACSDAGQGETFAAAKQSSASDLETFNASSSSVGYVALFVRMLGIDHNPKDREQAVSTLWKYSLGGKQCVDNIMKHPGTVILIVNLLKSNSVSACEAAAGLLRVVSSINIYRDLVAESGAVEEITSLLISPSLSRDVKEQALCTLWNLSVDEKVSARITSSEILPLLVRYLDDEAMRVQEAALGVLANLTLSQSNHKIMVEAGVIPKLAELLMTDAKEFKDIRKVARTALLELAKDEYYRILIIEEGLVPVPLVSAGASKSFKRALPSLPDGTITKSEESSEGGTSELQSELHIENKTMDLKAAKIPRKGQEFLIPRGAIEIEDDNQFNSGSQRLTILRWQDAVAQLVLILGLEDESAIARAAGSIADASISEHMRISFREAGAIEHLIQLISHPNDSVRLAAIRALDRLSISKSVCKTIEAEGVLPPLVNLLKQSESHLSGSLAAMILNILTRILDPDKELKSKIYDGPMNGSKKGRDVTSHLTSAKGNEMSSLEPSSMQAITGGHLIDSTFLSRLVEILKTSNPDLQRKAASILEFFLVIEPSMEKLIPLEIESGLEAVFRQKSLMEMDHGTEDEKPERQILEGEEAGLAVAAGSRLLTKLLDYEQFHSTVDSHRFTELLRAILMSSIPLQNKDWVAACLVKLSSLSGHHIGFEDPVNAEVTLYETVPRLVQQIKSSDSPKKQEAAVLELSRIISEGMEDSTRAIASEGGIFPLVKLMENGSDRAVEASLAILYSLSMDSENHAAIIAAGAVPLLRKLVLSKRPHWMRALRLLRTLPT